MASSAAQLSPKLNDLGLLISILHTAQPAIWHNVKRTMRRLRPQWSSLAVDMWQRSSNSSAADARLAVLTRHANVLALFSRVLFLDTAPRDNVNLHVRPSFSYRMHWHASFGDPASRWNFGSHSEGLPTLLAGIDADVTVPHNLPLDRLARVLATTPVSSVHAVTDAEQRARGIWLRGEVPPCRGPRSSSAASPSFAATSLPSSHAALSAAASSLAGVSSFAHGIPTASASGATPSVASPCEVVTERHRPLFISPRNLADLAKERRTSFAELGMYFSHLGMGNCCGRQNVNAPASLHLGAATATLSRGPWCPPSTFWILHRRSLDRMLTSLTLWQQAWDAMALTRDQKRLRWEYTSCAMLSPDEAALLLYYNHTELAHATGERPDD